MPQPEHVTPDAVLAPGTKPPRRPEAQSGPTGVWLRTGRDPDLRAVGATLAAAMAEDTAEVVAGRLRQLDAQRRRAVVEEVRRRVEAKGKSRQPPDSGDFR